MNSRDLEYLVAVVEELHFGRAAAQCNASQPALSGQLRKLEERLDLQVFERTKRHVGLTAIGGRVVEQAREVLRHVTTMEWLAATHKDPISRRCRSPQSSTTCRSPAWNCSKTSSTIWRAG